jgi:hypothetical protein
MVFHVISIYLYSTQKILKDLIVSSYDLEQFYTKTRKQFEFYIKSVFACTRYYVLYIVIYKRVFSTIST